MEFKENQGTNSSSSSSFSSSFFTSNSSSSEASTSSRTFEVKEFKFPEKKHLDNTELLKEFKRQNQAEKDKKVKPIYLAGGGALTILCGVIAWRAHVLATDPARAQEVSAGWQQFIENYQFWFGMGVAVLLFLGEIAYIRLTDTPSARFKKNALDLAKDNKKDRLIELLAGSENIADA